MPDVLRRHRATTKTWEKYRGKPFEWNGANCLGMLRSHLVAMGHRKLPKLPNFSTPLQAKRALKGRGFEDLRGLVGSILPEIAPAEAMQGDIILLKGDEHFDAITVAIDEKVMGWGWDTPDALHFVTMTPHEYVAAFRA